MLFLCGVSVKRPGGALYFHQVKAVFSARLARFTQTSAKRIGRYLERHGLLERDTGNSSFAGNDLKVGERARILSSSIIYRIAVRLQ